MGVTYLVGERPSCLVCKHWMGLARVSPGERGFEERTFECRTCNRMAKVSYPVDPMKTDAVGWMASHLRPSRWCPVEWTRHSPKIKTPIKSIEVRYD